MSRRSKRGRPVHGILLLNKPLEITSSLALKRSKCLINAQKAGHTGSLDPMATGMLPLCFGEATKVSGYLLDADKRYIVEGVLGSATDTADIAGEVIRECPLPEMDVAEQHEVINSFLGESFQVPPMYSALQIEGKRLHKLARAGMDVEREPRKILIQAITILECRRDYLKLEVTCSKGTYIRTLIEDMATAMGTCGHVSTLHRSGVSCFDGNSMTSLEELEKLAEGGAEALDSLLLPLDIALSDWPKISLGQAQEEKILHGQRVSWPLDKEQVLHRLYGHSGNFIGIGTFNKGNLQLKRMIRPDREPLG